MTASPLMKRVIQTLTPTEQYIRTIDRAKEIREAARARLDAEYIERIEEARNRYLPVAAVQEHPSAEEA